MVLPRTTQSGWVGEFVLISISNTFQVGIEGSSPSIQVSRNEVLTATKHCLPIVNGLIDPPETQGLSGQFAHIMLKTMPQD